MEQRRVILSGIQPSGRLTIGHYAGALRNWVALQRDYECFFMVADLHAITVRQDPAELRQRTLETAALFLACGIDPQQSVLFVQSHVPEHTQLTWVLACLTGMGECSRMTQFKEKSAQHRHNVNVGLFAYPILMAADILLYQADLVPVGADQKQHLELARNLAERFNYHYGETFRIPEPYIPPVGAKIMSLQEPTKKMSKSDPNESAVLFLTDTPDDIRRKIRRAITDSGREIRYDEKNRPGISNLIVLYHVATGKSIPDIEQEFEGAGYADLKAAVAEALIEFLRPIREEYERLMAAPDFLFSVLLQGAEKARSRAQQTLRRVYERVGFLLTPVEAVTSVHNHLE
ncbi:MAG: tryptophan--tRNA ligase [Candidatus Kapabacteria bacterium]|nr:tryptophan--tRNA ligase [Candidatus Kapabacteria bacterium]MDW8011475.1 tryptophan--tRNA ligase [Bacteroidota bacterium]